MARINHQAPAMLNCIMHINMHHILSNLIHLKQPAPPQTLQLSLARISQSQADILRMQLLH